MLPLTTNRKTSPMRNAQLLTVAFGLIACTHLQQDSLVCNKDNTPVQTNLPKKAKSTVVPLKPPQTSTTPELPFFKDVFNFKLLF